MKIFIELTEYDLKKIVKEHIERETGILVEEKAVKILVKSKQNFKSEWENAEFKAEYTSG